MTAQELINAALRLLKVKMTAQTLSAEEASDALEALNTMLYSWDIDGVPVFHSALALTDTIQLPDSHLKAIKYNLAVELAPEFEGSDLNAIVMTTAINAYDALRRQYTEINELRFDPSLVNDGSFNILSS